MKPAIYTQADSDETREIVSLETGTDNAHPNEGARQEFKKETDTNQILANFGITPDRRPLVFGEMDFDMGLHEALEAQRAVAAAYRKMPQRVKDRYATPEDMLAALDSGELAQYLKEPEPTPAPPEPTPTP